MVKSTLLILILIFLQNLGVSQNLEKIPKCNFYPKEYLFQEDSISFNGQCTYNQLDDLITVVATIENGRLISEKRYSNGEIISKHEFKYNNGSFEGQEVSWYNSRQIVGNAYENIITNRFSLKKGNLPSFTFQETDVKTTKERGIEKTLYAIFYTTSSFPLQFKSIRVGEFEFYHDNGIIESKGKFDDFGIPNGKWTYWHENGTKKAEGFHKNYDRLKHSMLSHTDINDYGIKSRSKDGKWVYWYSDGNIKEEGKYTEGRMTGTWKFYHPNGSKKAEGFYMGFKKSLQWIFWYPNGVKQAEGSFIDDKPIDEFKLYSKDNKIQASGQLIFDEKEWKYKPIGIWKIMEESGKVLFEGELKNLTDSKLNEIILPEMFDFSA